MPTEPFVVMADKSHKGILSDHRLFPVLIYKGRHLIDDLDGYLFR